MSVSEPGKIITPWAESGLKNTIPPAANPATGRAGFDQGFSAINMTAKEAGGIPPFGQDFNGIFYEITNILRYMQAGGQPTFDAALATAIGGYPLGAVLIGDDGVSVFQNAVAGNETNPNTGGDGWTRPDLQIMELYRRSYAEAGYNVVGTFQDGFTYVNANDVGIDLATGKGYTGPAGTYPPNTNPALGSFVDRSGLLPGAGVVRNDKFALRDLYSVKDYGATGLGLVDESAAFSLAAINAPAINNIVGAEGTGLPRAEMCNVIVPAGTYNIASLVDVGNRHVIWQLDAAAKIINPANLNGKIHREGIRETSGTHHGTTDYACGMSLKTNQSTDDGAEVLGIAAPNQLGLYADRDSVSMYVSNTAPPVLASLTNCTFTATTVTTSGLTAAQLKQMRKGMIIDTTSPRHSGVIESWNVDGTVITVRDGWYAVTGVVAPAVTPPNGLTCNINPMTKIWAHNANVGINANSHATGSTGFELGLLNGKGPGVKCWGYDSVNLGTFNGDSAFIARNEWDVAFHAFGVVGHGYKFEGSGYPLIAQNITGGTEYFSITSQGNMEVGHKDANGGIWYLDAHVNTAADYDARIRVSGGSATNGAGTLSLDANTIQLNTTGGVIHLGSTQRPFLDNVYDYGSAGFRGRTAYFGTGTINTSDAREKTAPLAITDAVLDAWGDVQLITFKWLEAIQKKGYDARWHFGVIAQQVRDAFLARGLDGCEYGLLCYDKWEDEFEPVYGSREIITTDFVFNRDACEKEEVQRVQKELYDTGEVKQTKAAGDRWGIRPDQCLFLEAAYQRRRCDRIEQRLADAGF